MGTGREGFRISRYDAVMIGLRKRHKKGKDKKLKKDYLYNPYLIFYYIPLETVVSGHIHLYSPDQVQIQV